MVDAESPADRSVMQFLERHSLDDASRSYARQAASRVVPGIPGWIVFDNRSSHEMGHSSFSDPGLARHVAVEGCPAEWPADILDIAGRNDCAHLVWLSAEVLTGGPALILWALSHELAHVAQNEECPSLMALNQFIESQFFRVFRRVANSLDLPVELDAERTAKSLVEEILGPDGIEEYFRAPITRQRFPEEYRQILEDRISASTQDVIADTLRLFDEGMRSRLEAKQRDGKFLRLDLAPLERLRTAAVEDDARGKDHGNVAG